MPKMNLFQARTFDSLAALFAGLVSGIECSVKQGVRTFNPSIEPVPIVNGKFDIIVSQITSVQS